MESKRLGRTLPAVINGLSAAQAQSQGFIEIPSDADTASVANSETLFVGESDDESISSRSRSGSPQNIRNVSEQAPQLNPAATPFDPKPITAAPARSNPFAAATTFGKPSGTQIQINSTPVFDFNSKTTNQAAHNPFQSKDPPKFNFPPPGKPEESKGTSSVFGSKEPPKASLVPSPWAPKSDGISNGPVFSSPTLPMDGKRTFSQSSITHPATTTSETTKSVVEDPPSLVKAGVPSKTNSVFGQPAVSSAPPIFSFETSPLFESARTESKSHGSKANPLQTSEERAPSISAPQQRDAAIKPPTFTTPSTSGSTPFSLFTPSNPLTKETNLLQAAPFKASATSDTILPIPDPPTNSRSTHPSQIFPPSTAPNFPLPLASSSPKPLEAIQTPNPNLEPTSFNPRPFSGIPVVESSESQPSPGQPTSTPSQLDPRSIAIDQLSEILLLEDNGIIQHFIEFTVGSIIKASIAQFKDESSWKEASQSSPVEVRCGKRMLIGNRGMSCNLISQEVF